MNFDLKTLNIKIEKTKEWFKKETTGLRTSRANPSLIENIKIDCCGVPTALNHLASVRIADIRTLIVEPWDKNILPEISKALTAASLGFQPIVDKTSIRILFPELTQERRQTLEKILKQKLEEAKIALRKDRDEIWRELQVKQKKGEISEDEKFRLKDRLQKEIDKANQELESLFESKKRELYA